MVSRNSVPRNSLRRWRRRAALTLTVVLLASLAAPQLLGDDRELLRKDGGDPYLFVLLDSSTSMTLTIDNKWVHANGNDPRSRIYQAKEVLYNLLRDLDGVRFGFATFNQDQLRIQSKHFLYYVETDQAAKIANLGIGYPSVEADGATPPFGGDDVVEYQVVDTDGNIDTVVDIDGDMMTFGQTLGGSASKGKACNDPLSLVTDRERINRVSKLGVDGTTVTRIWVVDGGGTRYLVTFDGTATGATPGATTMDVEVTVTPDTGCDGLDPNSRTETLTFKLWRDFLMTDDGSGTVTFAQSGLGVGNTGPESSGGFAEWSDALGNFDCGDSKPFSGGGWEGNYDTGRPLSTNPAFEESLAGYDINVTDRHCDDPAAPSGCELLQFDTTYETSPDRRELDRGDVLPFHWNFDNKDDFLKRLNPNHGSGLPQFGAAPYFEDVPDATGRLQLRNADRVPIVPAGPSPISDAILDFRCWYLGTSNKCGRGGLEDIYTKGFMTLLEEHDPGAFDCRQPFLIVITDMELNCPGNSTVANAAGMNSDSGGGSVGVSTWVFNLGTVKVTGLNNAGKGEEIKIDSKAKLRTELQKVLGIIEESSRSFASAAVPSVQADVEDKIYITQFTPRQEASVWEGHVHAFLKPLPTVPVDPNDPAAGFRPDTDSPNHLWDGAEVLLTTQAPALSSLTVPLDRAELRIGATASQRRLFYAVGDTDPATDADGDGVTDNDTDSKVPRTRSIFGPYTSAAENPASGTMDLNQVRKDLWLGMGIVDDSFTFLNTADDMTDLFAQHNAEAVEAHNTFLKTYAIRVVQPRDDDGNAVGAPVEYVLGDIFHATPQLVGNPANGRYLARPDTFPGYEEYFEVQARRRKVLFIASDDGQLHAFDAGRFARTDNVQEDPDVSVEDGQFNNGTGVELFAYTPRVLLERLKTLADAQIGHEWGVDGTPAVSDVRIDPIHGGVGSADPPKEADRQWRTALVGGLRRGGKAYYALDVTKPDKMVEETETVAGTPVTLGWKPDSPTQVVPGCLQAAGLAANPGDCDPSGFNYPEVLWELTDPDLGETWSSPDMGAIEVIDNGTTVVKYVAVFGGGMDPGGFLRESDITQGRMLYIVDVETGKILYKRQLEGAVPSAPAAVDTDQDGLLDRIYVGTTEGLMYRVNIATPQDLEFAGACTASPPVGSTDRCCATADGPVSGCVNDPAWEPFVIFDTASDSTPGDSTFTPDPATRKPIFFRPSVIFSSQLGRYALGFGTGNRENLWAREQASGNRFYLFVDDSDIIDPALLPRFENDYVEVTSQEGIGVDLLQDPADGNRGWFVRLGTVQSPSGIDVTHEKVLTPMTAISGLSVVSTFVPETTVTTSGSGNNATIQCARRGISRVFNQFTANGEEVPVPDSQGNLPPECLTPPCDRNPDEISTLVSEPFIEQADAPCAGTEGMAELLKDRIFPPNCNFASYRWNLSAMRSDTGIECLAQIPVCIIEKNWKDF